MILKKGVSLSLSPGRVILFFDRRVPYREGWLVDGHAGEGCRGGVCVRHFFRCLSLSVVVGARALPPAISLSLSPHASRRAKGGGVEKGWGGVVQNFCFRLNRFL